MPGDRLIVRIHLSILGRILKGTRNLLLNLLCLRRHHKVEITVQGSISARRTKNRIVFERINPLIFRAQIHILRYKFCLSSTHHLTFELGIANRTLMRFFKKKAFFTDLLWLVFRSLSGSRLFFLIFLKNIYVLLHLQPQALQPSK